MPGVVSALSVAAGQAVKAGDVLLSIEAMKMETALMPSATGRSPRCWSRPAIISCQGSARFC
ncbi:biotin/lipoyl-binding protein [Mesorhizobium sp. M0618]|uniref:biotin/lipoyl-binding protein n=1 Tax=unclassified Mesorhizobium TaxID=325217 RepID=UPI00333D50AA